MGEGDVEGVGGGGGDFVAILEKKEGKERGVGKI